MTVRLTLSIAWGYVIFKLSEMETLSLCFLVCRHTLIMRKETGAHKCAPVHAKGETEPQRVQDTANLHADLCFDNLSSILSLPNS